MMFVCTCTLCVGRVAGGDIASFPGRKKISGLQKISGLVLTVCTLMRMHSILQNLGNPVISVNHCSFLRPENEASLDARLLTNVNIEGG